MKSRRILALICVVFLGGCAHPRSRLTLGIYDPPHSAFPELAEAGFDVIVAAASQDTLDSAREAGLSVLMQGATAALQSADPRRSALKFDRHPAAWGWYLWDEPDLHQVSPGRVAAQARRLGQFASKPTVLVLSSGYAVEKYAGLSTVLAVDWYPIPWSSVGTIAREMRLARLGADGQPFWAILQAFDWNTAREQLRTDIPLRAPTREELRCMAYLALMQGAEGILFYTYRAGEWNIESDPDLRRAVFDIAGEIRARESIFGERLSWWPTHTEYHGPPESMSNEIGEARISMALFRSREPGRPHYMLVANTTEEPCDFSFKLPFRNLQEVPAFCADTSFSMNQDWIRKTFEPFEVCIIGPIKGELADE